MDISAILASVLSNSIPSVAIMITGLVTFFFASTKLEGSNKNIFAIIGAILIVFGATITALISAFQVQKSYPSELLFFWTFISPIFSINTIFILIGICVVFWFAIWLNKKIIEKSYKLELDFVSDNETNYGSILVNNIGNETIYCVARLRNVEINGKEININKFNPKGLFFDWEYDTKDIPQENCAKLVVGVPQSLHVFYCFGSKLKFELDYSQGKNIDHGICKVTVDFFRLKDGKFIYFYETTGKARSTLNAKNEVEVEWV